jgi:hypothetical protein
MHSLTSALDGGEWSGGPQSLSGRGGEEKNSQPLPGLEPPVIQPIAQRYTTRLSRGLLGKKDKESESGEKKNVNCCWKF